MKRFIPYLCVSLVVGNMATANAHQLSTAYMEVMQIDSQPYLRWKVAVHDLANAGLLGTTAAQTSTSWQQVSSRYDAISDYVNTHIAFKDEHASCDLSLDNPQEWALQNILGDIFLIMPIRAHCTSEIAWKLHYQALFSSAQNHKLLLSWHAFHNSKATLSPRQQHYPTF